MKKATTEPAVAGDPLDGMEERVSAYLTDNPPGGALPATGRYVDRLVRIFRDRPADDTSASVLQDYARVALSSLAEPAGEATYCQICTDAIRASDICATDIELGICHAACLEGSPVVVLDTGEPVEGPADTFPFEPAGGAERLPTREEAQQAAKVLLRCNGADLSDWGGDDLLDDSAWEALIALAGSEVR